MSQDQRAAFEEVWCKGCKPYRRTEGTRIGNYVDEDLQARWEGWQAALAQPRSISDAEITAIAAKHFGSAATTQEIAFARALLAAQAAPVQEGEPFKWEATTEFYIRYVTDSRYKTFSPAVQKWYRPICQQCAEEQP